MECNGTFNAVHLVGFWWSMRGLNRDFSEIVWQDDERGNLVINVLREAFSSHQRDE
jgi:hypothetical protein